MPPRIHPSEWTSKFSRLFDTAKCCIWNAFDWAWSLGYRDSALTKQIRYKLQEPRIREKFKDGKIPSPATIRNHTKKFINNHGEFTTKENRNYTKQPRKVTPSARKQIARTMAKTASSYQTAREYEYECEETGETIEISKTTALRIAKEECKRIDPTRNKVILTPHYCRGRVIYSKQEKEKNRHRKIITGDEASFGMKEMFVRRQDHIYVLKCDIEDEDDDIDIDNVWYVQDSDVKQVLSMHTNICYDGMVNCEITKDNFSKEKWAEFLMKPAFKRKIDKMKRENKFEFYLHDNCMAGGKPVDELNHVFGENKWSQKPPPPCRVKIGTKKVYVKRSRDGKRKAHWRTIDKTRPSKRCRCEFGDNFFCAKGFELNPTENYFNELRRELRAEYKRTKTWPRDADELEARIRKCVNTINKNKDWFHKTFDSLPRRYDLMIKHKGKTLREFGYRY